MKKKYGIAWTGKLNNRKFIYNPTREQLFLRNDFFDQHEDDDPNLTTSFEYGAIFDSDTVAKTMLSKIDGDIMRYFEVVTLWVEE